MAKFRVIGAERDTGAPVDCELEAADAAHAERIANSRGVLVRSVQVVSERAEPVPAPPPAAPEPAGPEARVVRAFVGAPRRPRRPAQRVGLRFDLDTIGAIGCGVVLGFGLLWAISLALAIMFWGVIFGAAAGAAG